MEIIVKALTAVAEVTELETLYEHFKNGYTHILASNYQDDLCLVARGNIEGDIIEKLKNELSEEAFEELMWISKEFNLVDRFKDELYHIEVLYNEDDYLIARIKDNDYLKDIKFHVEKGD